MQLVLVPHRRRAAFHVADVAPLVRHDQRPLELARLRRVDPEVRGQLHRTAHALRHVDERAVGEHRRVERREEVVGVRHHRAQVLLHQVRVLLHRLRERAEDDAVLLQLLLERRRHRDAVEDGIHRHTRQPLLLLQRDPQLLVGGQQLRIDLVQALGTLLRCRVVADRLVVDGTVAVRQERPLRLAAFVVKLLPVAVSLQPPLEHPFRLALLFRDEPDDVLVQTRRSELLLDVRREAVLVLLARDALQGVRCRTHDSVLGIAPDAHHAWRATRNVTLVGLRTAPPGRR